MKWIVKHDHLEKREITKFAWFPIVIKVWDRREIRWLETVKIEQHWCAFGGDIRIWLFGGCWKNEFFR